MNENKVSPDDLRNYFKDKQITNKCPKCKNKSLTVGNHNDTIPVTITLMVNESKLILNHYLSGWFFHIHPQKKAIKSMMAFLLCGMQPLMNYPC